MNLLDFVKNIPGEKPDKYDLGYVNEFYDKLFTPRKTNCTKLLEIGIQYGLSLLMWRDYFVNAEIYGIDVDYCHHVINSERIFPVFQNAYSKSCLELFEPNSFDIVIDDGPHTLESMIFFCKYYFDLVKPGGIFIIEDIVDPNWTPILLNLIGKKYKTSVFNMPGKCLTEHLNQKWKNGLDVIVVEK